MKGNENFHSSLPISNSSLCRAHQTYYMFGFLFLVFIILIITCSEATILLAYFHLCAEDYRWFVPSFPTSTNLFHPSHFRWWRSFFTSGFTAIYLFLYCIHFFNTKLTISGAVSTILYFSYTAIFVFVFFLMTGLSFYSSFFQGRNRIPMRVSFSPFSLLGTSVTPKPECREETVRGRRKERKEHGRERDIPCHQNSVSPLLLHLV